MPPHSQTLSFKDFTQICPLLKTRNAQKVGEANGPKPVEDLEEPVYERIKPKESEKPKPVEPTVQTDIN